MDALHFEAHGTFRVAPEALWPLVSDTARMNRAIGSPPVVHTIMPVEGGGSRVEGEIRLGGLTLARYAEHPFRWEAPHGFVVVRELQAGPLLRIRAGARLTQVEDGTEVVIYGDFVPRTALGAALARLVGPRSVQNTIRQCRSFERYLLGESDQPYPQLAWLPRLSVPPWLARRPEARGSGVDADSLVAQGLSREAVELLRHHLAEAPDEDVARMGPFELADRWGLDRHETLGLFLHATAAGLLVMRWEVLCPNCRVSKAQAVSLRDLAERAHCETCNISFDAAFDRSVEVRFSVAPTVRTVSTAEYCIGGPMNTPHVVAQTVVPPGGSERLNCQLAPGPYRLRPRGSRGRLMLAAADAPVGGTIGGAALAVTVHPEAVEPALADVSAGPLILDLVNATDREQVVLVEGSLWPDTVVTAATVCANQEFRDLFPLETVAPGVRLGIESLAFLVVEHSSRPAERAIGDHRGAVVQSDGATVLATFSSAADAVAAGLRIQRHVPGARIGIHQGACVVANVDGRLGYVGRTVDVAGGLARASHPGEIVASLDVCRSAGAASLLQAAGVSLDDALLQLPEAGDPVPVFRITPLAVAPVLAAPSAASDSLATSDQAPVLPGASVLRDWLARRHGPLLFDYRPGSYAGERIDAVAAAYASALDRIVAFLGRAEATLPLLRIRLLDVPPDEQASSPAVQPRSLGSGDHGVARSSA
jgi:adenylate cyclase